MHAFTHMSHVLLTILMDLPCWNHSIFYDYAIASSSTITLLSRSYELVSYLWSKSLITCSYDNQRDSWFGEAPTFKGFPNSSIGKKEKQQLLAMSGTDCLSGTLLPDCADEGLLLNTSRTYGTPDSNTLWN